MGSEPKTFVVRSPHMRGEDIKRFQRDLNARFEDFDIDKRIPEDSDFGMETRHAAKQVCIGLGILHEIAMKDGVTPELRSKIRDPRKCTGEEKRRAEGSKAKEFRSKLRKRSKAGVLANVQVTPTPGKPHWGGSNDVLRGFVEPFMVKQGLPIGSGKRPPAGNVAAGGASKSDHLTTQTTAAARDFPTFAGEDEARALAKAMGFSAWQPNSFNKFQTSIDGHSFGVQILWGAEIDHADHVHVGISRA